MNKSQQLPFFLLKHNSLHRSNSLEKANRRKL